MNSIKDIMEKDFNSEFEFITSRSSGAGGQNVNKVSTKVTLRFNVLNSDLLSEEEKDLISKKLINKINSDGFLQITSQSERTQLANKEICIQKFYILIKKALTIQKKRKQTKPSQGAIEKRLETKRKKAEQKINRRKIE